MAFEESIHSRHAIGNEHKVKVYIFSEGMSVFKYKVNAINYVENMLYENPRIHIGNPKYAIAAVWGMKPKIKAVDIFTYFFDDSWEKCNPEVKGWVYKNGVLQRDHGVSCGTGLIILGKEEELRRTTKSLEDYMNEWPDLGSLGPKEGD